MNLKKTVDGGKTLLKNWWNEIVENNFTTIQNTFNAHEKEAEETAAILTDIKAGKATITGTEKKGTVQLVSAGNSKTSSDIQTITFECGKTANAYVGGQVWIESISGQWLDGKDIVFSDETFDIKSVAEGLVSLYVYVKSISADNEVTMGLGIIDLLHDPISPVLPDGEGGETGETDLQNFFRLTNEQIIIGEGKDCRPHTYTKETIYRAKQIAISDGDGTVRLFDIEQTAIIPALEVKKQLSEELYNKINALASEDANLSEKITTETTARETADNSLIKQINEKIGFESSEYIKAWGEVIDWDSQLEPKIYSISNETHIPSGLPSENGQGLIFVYKTDEELLPVSDPNTQKAYVQCTFSQMYISGRNVYYRKTGSYYELDSNSDIIDDSPNGIVPQWSEWQKIVPNVGDLSDLNTADKSSIVSAINEVNADGSVTTSKLADEAVTKTKIADGAISEGKFDSELSAAFTGKENSENKGRPNGYAPLDASGKLPDSYLYGVTVKQYGVRWNGTSSTVCERLGDAVGLTAKAHKGSTESVDNDFDNIYPWSDIKTCNIDVDGNVLAYLGEPSFARDGTNGDVMVEIPKFYYKRVKTGIVEEIWICGTKLPGYELHPLFIDNGKEVSKVFHSVYNASSYTDEADSKVKLQSITGVQPRVRTTRANFRTYARNKGDIWGIEDISCVNALQLLYLVEYANTHSQSVLGSGADSLSYTANHKALEETTNGNTITIASTYKNVYKLGQRIEIGTSQGESNITTTPRTVTAITTDDETGRTTITFDGDPITIAVGNMIWNVAPMNGSCDDLNGKSGWLAGENNYSDCYADVNYRGIEGFHAKLFRFIDGVNIKDRVVYYANSMADYTDGVYDGKYRAVGYTNGTASGYISGFGYDEKAPWVMFPTEVKGGSTTYVPDYYSRDTGERLPLLGGNFLSNMYDGVFCFGCVYVPSYSGLSCGSHLLVKKP